MAVGFINGIKLYKGRIVGGMSSSKRLPCQKEACAIQKCLQGKQTLEFCLISIVLHEKNTVCQKNSKLILSLTLLNLSLS